LEEQLSKKREEIIDINQNTAQLTKKYKWKKTGAE